MNGTQIKAWASMKSFVVNDGGGKPPEDGGSNPTVDFKGEKPSNATHVNTTDPETRLNKKAEGGKSHLAYQGHALLENRNGLVVDAETNQASTTAQREAAKAMVARS